MVSLGKRNGIRFVIYTNDHAPAQVHAISNEGEARIDLTGTNVALIEVRGEMKRADISKALEIAESNRHIWLQKWTDIHGTRD